MEKKKRGLTLTGLIIIFILLFGCTGGNGDTEEASSKDNTVGVIGCSITINALNGYAEQTGSAMWAVKEVSTYGGGSVSGWYEELTGQETGSNSSRWQSFKDAIEKYPQTEKVWWEMCASPDTADRSYEQIIEILDEIKRIAPDTEIYVTPMPNFPDSPEDSFCIVNGGVEIFENYASRMVSEGLVKAGPKITPLNSSNAMSDGCHATHEGQLIWGQDLIDFFGIGEGTGIRIEQTGGPQSPPNGQGFCGDDICDQIETDRNICPEDCE